MKKYTGVYQDKNGTFYYKFSASTLDKVRVHKTKRGFNTAKTAYEAKLVEKSKIEGLTSQAVKSNTSQFIGLIDGYLERLKSNKVKPNTIASYVSVYKTLVIPFFKNYSVDDIDVTSLQNFKNLVMSKKLSDITKNRYINRLTTFLEHLQLFNHISNEKLNSFLVILEPPRVQEKTSGCKGIYSKDEYNLFLEQLTNPKYKMAAHLLFHTGCRIGELLSLKKTDFDFETKTLTLSKNYVTRGENAPQVVPTLKTQYSRVIKITDFDIKEVLEYIELNKLSDDDYIFKGDGVLPIYPNQISSAFRIAMINANLPQIRLHDFRHSHSCYLLDKGVPDKAVADRLGHKDPSITRRVYDQLTKKKRMALDSALEDLSN